MNASSECETPFLLDKENLCNLTVYEFYEPFTTYLWRVSIALDMLMFFSLLVILVSFLKANKNKWYKNRRYSITPDEGKKKLFFKYNLLTILFLLIGAIFHLHLTYNNFLYDLDFRSNLGKKNSICIVYLSIFLYAGNFTFLPILKELLGLTKLSSRYEIPFFFFMPYLIYFEELEFATFKIICYSHGIISAILLIIVLYFTVTIVLQRFQDLTQHYIDNNKKREEINKLYTFKVKLNALKLSITFHTTLLTIISIPNFIPALIANKVILLLDSVYLTIIPLELLPSVCLYSKFILPGSEKCFSLDLEKNRSPLRSRRTQYNQENIRDVDRTSQVPIEEEKNRMVLDI
eukprot:snap_masked-scaffold_28-processed-gene-1.11-mRNA-1 protein AED:1.00 eAED:1.00 QI:0/0/0/0/1/1/2/0/347